MSSRLQVLIPPDLDAELRKAAQRSRVSKGEWVRRAIQVALGTGGQADKRDPLTRLASLNAPTADIDRMLQEIEQGRG
jgi:hypothetical protein